MKAIMTILNSLEQKIGSDDETIQSLRAHLERKNQEISRLSHDHELYKTMVELSPCLVCWVKKDLSYIGANSVFCDWMGLKPEDLTGKKLGDFYYNPEIRDFFKNLFDKTHPKNSGKYDLTINGEERMLFVQGKTLNNNQEAIVVGIDLTELSKVEKSMFFMERLSSVGEMMASIIHEINNPLSVIQAQASLIERKIHKQNDTSDLDVYIHRISETCGRMDKIIKGVKNYVHRDDEQDYAMEPFSIREVIEESMGMLAPRLKTSFVHMSYECNGEDFAMGNFIQLSQIIVNLVNNSIHAISEQKEKWVHLTVKDLNHDECEIHVMDSGRGIPFEVQEKIFDSFFTTKKSGEGTGIGLSLSRRMIEEMGGSLSLNTKSPFTCFVIRLKRAYCDGAHKELQVS